MWLISVEPSETPYSTLEGRINREKYAKDSCNCNHKSQITG